MWHLLDDSYLRANTTEGGGEGEGGEIGGEIGGETALALCAVQPEKWAFCWDLDWLVELIL